MGLVVDCQLPGFLNKSWHASQKSCSHQPKSLTPGHSHPRDGAFLQRVYSKAIPPPPDSYLSTGACPNPNSSLHMSHEEAVVVLQGCVCSSAFLLLLMWCKKNNEASVPPPPPGSFNFCEC